MIISLIYVFVVLVEIEFDWKLIISSHNILIIFVLIILYISQYYISALIWKSFLETLSGKTLPPKLTLQIYSKANIAKYLPGNIMHLAGRNILGKKLEIRQADLAIATMMEFVILIVTTLFLSAIFSFDMIVKFIYIITKNTRYFLLFVLMLISIFFLFFFFLHFLRQKESFMIKYQKLFAKETIRIILKAILVYSFSFFINGFIQIIVLNKVLKTVINLGDLSAILSIVGISWLSGFLIPGAPGGIGIRETVMIFLLGPLVGNNNVAISTIIVRIISILGDISFFLLMVIHNNKPAGRKL